MAYYTVSKQPSSSDTKKSSLRESVYASPKVEYQTVVDGYNPIYAEKKPSSVSDKSRTIYVNTNKYNSEQFQPKVISSHKPVQYDTITTGPVDNQKSTYSNLYKFNPSSYYQPSVVENGRPFSTDTQSTIQANNYNQIYVDNQKPVEYISKPAVYTKPSTVIEYQKPDGIYVSKNQNWSPKQTSKANEYVTSKVTTVQNNKQATYDTSKPAAVENHSPYYIASEMPNFMEQFLPKSEQEIQNYVYSQIPKFTENQKQVLFPETNIPSYVQSQFPKFVENTKPVVVEYYKPKLVEKEVPYYVENKKPIVQEKQMVTDCSKGIAITEKSEPKSICDKRPRVVEHHRTTYVNNNQPTVIEQTVVDSASCSNSCGQPVVWAKDVPIPKKFKDLSFLTDLDKDKSKSGSSASASAKTVVNIGTGV